MIDAAAMGAESWYLLLVVCLAFLGSVFGALSGFGGSLLVMPFLMPLVGVKGVIPVMTVAMLIGNASRIWVNRTDLDLAPIRWVLVSAVPGTILGTMIYDWLPPRAVAFIIGIVLILTVPLRALLRGRALTPSPAGGLAIGFGFGTMAGSSPGAGTLMVALLLGLGLTGPALIATDAVIGLAVNLVKAAMFGGFDLLDMDRFLLGLLLGMIMIPGAYVARMLILRLSVGIHATLIECLVVASGASFLWRAWSM